MMTQPRRRVCVNGHPVLRSGAGRWTPILGVGDSDQAPWRAKGAPRILSKKAIAAGIAVGAALLAASSPALAEEDCFNGPVPVDGAQRGQVTIPAGQAVRLTFNFNAANENMVFVCDALTGHRILEKGNFNRNREDWLSPIDNTKSLAYYIVAFHKTVPQNDSNAFRRPWIQSPLKLTGPFPVEGEGHAYVDAYGFNDGGGQRWDNALVTAYFVGINGQPSKPLSAATLQTIRSKFATE